MRCCLSLLLILVAGTLIRGAEPDDTTLDVVTYNIRYANPNDGPDIWDKRVDAVVEFLSRWDIAGLQEVTYPQLEVLRERLGDKFDFYGVGRDDGKRSGEFAAVFFRKDRLEAVDKNTYWLSPTPTEIGSKGWDAALPRTVTWMRFRDKKTGDQFQLANTHFDHRGKTARVESANLIRHHVADTDDNEPIVLMGDLNCTPGSEPYSNLVDRRDNQPGPFRDARLVATNTLPGPQSTWSGFTEIVPDRIIDHLFVRGNVLVTEFQIHDPRTDEGRFASDHLPVRIRVDMNGK